MPAPAYGAEGQTRTAGSFMFKLIWNHLSLVLRGSLFALFCADAWSFARVLPALADSLVAYSLQLADEARDLSDGWGRVAERCRGRRTGW